MDEHNDFSDHDLSRAANLPAMDAEFREELLSKSSHVIRARRVTRRLMSVSGLAASFLAGMFAMSQLSHPPAPSKTARTETTPPRAIEQMPNNAPKAEAVLFDDPEQFARTFESSSAAERLALLKAAGDHELEARGDVRSALQYYRQWITLANADARTRFDESDTWLLASLKLM